MIPYKYKEIIVFKSNDGIKTHERSIDYELEVDRYEREEDAFEKGGEYSCK